MTGTGLGGMLFVMPGEAAKADLTDEQIPFD